MTIKTLLDNVVWGGRWGLRFSMIWGVIACLIFLIGGDDPFERNHVSFLSTVAIYVIFCFGIGLLIGIFRPLARTKIGAGVIGFIGGACFSELVNLISNEPDTTIGGRVFVGLMMAIFLGTPVGLIYREIFLDETGTPRKKPPKRQ